MADSTVRYKTLVDLSRILLLFEEAAGERGVMDIAGSLDMLPSKVSRMLKTMELEGLVERHPKTGKYRAGARFLHLGLHYLFTHPVRRTILPHVEQIPSELGVGASWGIFTQRRVIIVDRVSVDLDHTPHLIGSDMPLHSSSYGKLFLAYLPKERQEQILQTIDYESFTPRTLTTIASLKYELAVTFERGYAIDREESRTNLGAISCPIFDESKNICAAITIVYHLSQNIDQEKALSYLSNKAAFISQQLGFKPLPLYFAISNMLQQPS